MTTPPMFDTCARRVLAVTLSLTSAWLQACVTDDRPARGDERTAATDLDQSSLPLVTTAPVLYSDPNRQSPVVAEPNDLLMLPGIGFAAGDRVVYQRLGDTTLALQHPTTVPTSSTATLGTAPVVSYGNLPHSLTVRLPSVMSSGYSYALWAVNTSAQWSNGIKINDARPLWIAPTATYRTASPPGLSRTLKVVGRNLQRRFGTVTRVRLRGPQTFTLTAASDGDPATSIENFAALVTLPTTMAVGSYAVDVQRDGVSWVTLPGQSLTVSSDPPAAAIFNVSAHGAPQCFADDGLDDTHCVLAAISAAHAAGGGNVLFGAGRWDLLDPIRPGIVNDNHGILLPEGVHLTGAGPQVTTVRKGPDWSKNGGQPMTRSVFTVLGRNTISRIRFEDAQTHQSSFWEGPFFLIGKYPSVPAPAAVSDVSFTQNIFAKPYIAIGDSNAPIRRVYVTSNEFGAYYTAIFLGGNRTRTDFKFHVDESIITGNVFKPGSYIDPCVGQGTIATQIGAGDRNDFSGNTADGRATDYLDGSLPGWRATFFWHMGGNHERTLISQNTATCTGDKAGDGEAIVFDNNANSFGFKAAKDVAQATATTLTVSTADGLPLQQTQFGISVPADYYNEHWIQVANGTALGQVRKISSYTTDAAAQTVTFTVSPAWDVVPQPGSSKITVAREAWQVHVVDNVIDGRGCTKNNQNGIKRIGYIAVAAMAADLAIEGNRQYESAGILVGPSYSGVDDPPAGYVHNAMFSYFVDVRRNTVAGEFDYASGCSWGGIQLSYGSASGPPPNMPPSPVILGYGVTIGRNTVSRADGMRGGAITFDNTWWWSPGSRMHLNTLVYHNAISDLPVIPTGGTATQVCQGTTVPCPADVPRGIGVNISLPVVHATVLAGNTFNGVTTPMMDNGTGTVQVP